MSTERKEAGWEQVQADHSGRSETPENPREERHMSEASEGAQTGERLCPLREKPCAGHTCQWWVRDTGDAEHAGDCAMIYLALKKEPKWQYAGRR